MKAVVVIGLVLTLAVSAAAHGGGGHSGGFGGHGGGHFGGHHGHGKSGHWGSARFSAGALSHVAGPPRLTTFVGFGSVPGFRVFFLGNSFFCPLVPHLVSPLCRFCGFGGGFLVFPGFGFVDGSGDALSGTVIPPSSENAQGARPVLVFTNGWTFEVTDYWIDNEGELRYVTTYGGTNIVPLQTLDLYATVKANARRGITFTLKLRPGDPEAP